MSLHAKIAQVMAEADRIPKRGTAPVSMGGYQFVQVGDAADAIRAALGSRGVSMLPSAVEIIEQSEHATAKGGVMTTVTVRTTWTLTDAESGESATIQSLGTGADTGDKYSPKAQTNAMKYALLMGFLLSTGDDPEAANLPERRVTPPPPVDERTDDGGLIGTLEIGDKPSSDFNLRQTPDGPVLGFRLRGGRGGILVRCTGALADQLAGLRDTAAGARVTVWGRVIDESFTPKGQTKAVTYQVCIAERVSIPGVGVLPTRPVTEITEAESAAIWDALEEMKA